MSYKVNVVIEKDDNGYYAYSPVIFQEHSPTGFQKHSPRYSQMH
jgi:hypothetical protein